MDRSTLVFIVVMTIAMACLVIYWRHQFTHWAIDFGDGLRQIKPLRDRDPAPRVCHDGADMMQLTLCLRAYRSGLMSCPTPVDRGFLLHLSSGEIPRHWSTRQLVYLAEGEEGPYRLLDDFISKDQFFAPLLELDGNRLRYVDRCSGNVIREVACSDLNS